MRGVQHSKGKRRTQRQKHFTKSKAAAAHAVAAAAHAVAPEPEPSVDNIAVAHGPVGAPEPIVDVHVNAPIDALTQKKRRLAFTHPLETKNVSSHMSNRNINIARAARAANDVRAALAAQYKWNPNNNNNNVSNSAEPNVVTEAEADVETKSVIVPVTKANTINQYKKYLTKVGPKSKRLGPRENIFESDNIDEGLLSEEDREMREQLRTASLQENNIQKIRRNAVALRGLNRIEYENQKRSPITKRLLSLVGKSKNKTTKRFLNEEMRQKAYNSNNSLKQAMLAKNPNFVYQPNRMSNRLTKRAINNADREETRRIYEEEQIKIDIKREEIAKKQRQRENNIKTQKERQKERFKAEKEAAKAEEIARIKAAKAEEIERIRAAKAEEIERIKAAKAAKAAEIQRIKEAQAHNEERRKLTLKAENNLWKTRKSDEGRLRESERQELAAALAEKEKIAPGRWTRFKTGLKRIFTKKNNNKK